MIYVCLLLALIAAHDGAGPIDERWHSPHELLPLLAQRDGIRWAMPETLSGRAWVGGDFLYKAAWVGAMDFDPEHNVFVLMSFKDKQVWAYRHKPVEVGTKMK